MEYSLSDNQPAEKPRGEARRTAAVVLAGFCAFLDLYAPQPMLPELARHFGRTPGQVSQLVSISTIAVAIAAPFAGALSDRWGRKRLIVASALLLAVPVMLAATASGFGQLLFWRFFVGILTPGVFALTVTYINEEWQERAGQAMAAYVSGTVLGGFAGRMLAAIVAEHASWQLAFLILGVLNALGGAAIWLWLPREKHRAPATRGVARAMLLHLKNPRLLATYAAGFCVLFSLLGVFTYVNFHLAAAPFRLGTAALGNIFVVYLAGALFTPLAGKWIDRLGQRKAFALAMLLALAGVLVTLIPSLVAVIAGLAIFCTGIFIGQSSASSFIGRAAKGAKAAAVGLYVSFYYLGGTFGAAVPGLFWRRFGWTGCVALMACAQLVTAAIALRFWRIPANESAAALPSVAVASAAE
jgi:predicted MFS family arabinose efflux permease